MRPINYLSPGRIWRSAKQRFDTRAAFRKVDESFFLLKGSKQQILQDDVALIVIGRNVSNAIEHVINYHRTLGATHVLYVDNGSEDDSVDKAMALKDVMVASCTLDFRIYQKQIRQISARKYLFGGWRLMLDADELFDYPASDYILLPDLVRELRKRNKTAVIAQMLDMVPNGPLLDHPAKTLKDAVVAHIGCSLSSIQAVDYHSQESELHWFLNQNHVANRNIKLLFGGIRAQLFGENCMLTKHPLIRMEPGVTPMVHPHISTGLKCAGFSALIRHYKFCGDFVGRERNELLKIKGNKSFHSYDKQGKLEEMELRVKAFDSNPKLSFGVPDLITGPSFDLLFAKGFLVANAEAREYLGI